MTSNHTKLEELMKHHAPRALIEDGEASAYLCSLVTSDELPTNNEDDLTALIDQFFSEYRDEDGSDDHDARNLVRAILKQHQLATEEDEKATKGTTAVVPSEQLVTANSPHKDNSCGDTIPSMKKPPKYIDRSEMANAKKKSRERKMADRQQRRKNQGQKRDDVQPVFDVDTSDKILANSTLEMEEMDDHGIAWAELQADGKDTWGGKGKGGRGIRLGANTASNIHLSGVSLQYAGNDLLQNATIQINGSHRYGLIGRNGVGKTTLLRRLANNSIPGFPRTARVLLVKQEVEGSDKSTIQTLMDSDEELLSLLQEQSRLEKEIDKAVIGGESEGDLTMAVERLGIVSSDLDTMDADGAEERAKVLLRGLQFTDDMIDGPTNHLSGGWRMRLAIAQALFVSSDLILLDEPTNHLDYYALVWLAEYLSSSNHTLIVVSHDRAFLDDVCTDIMLFEHKKLSYHVGNYSAFQQQQDEKHARQAQILDASERKRAKAISFVEQQQRGAGKKKYQDPKKQRQAKMVKEKKLDRIGNYREDGKRYKTRSIKKLSEDYLRTPEQVVIEADEPVVKFKFVDPTWPSGIAPGSPLIQADNMSFSYFHDGDILLKSLTLDINRESKIALVGKNGSGKSTLMNIFTGKISPEERDQRFTGNLWTHPCLRIGHVTQHSVERLNKFAHMTVVEYAEKELLSGSACASISSSAGGSKNVRQYLGVFGLGGAHANREIGKLSGGERMRLCFATVMAESPHLLCLDEPSNHLDMETLDALAAALDSFRGAVIVISHNQSFLCGFCKELWVVNDGKVEVRHDDSFADMFNLYKREAIAGASDRKSTRTAKAKMAKKANQQRAGRTERSGFIGLN